VAYGPRAPSILPGKYSSTCASPSGTSWSSRATPSTNRPTSPADTGPAPQRPHDKAWDGSVHAFHKDLSDLCALVADSSTDLFARIPHGDGQTILREALLAADHNAYHLGELVLLRRLLGAWK